MSRLLYPDVTLTIGDDPSVERVDDGQLILDSGAIPYAVADIILPLPPDVSLLPAGDDHLTAGQLPVLFAIDPHDDHRVVVSARNDPAMAPRIFDLGLRSRTIDPIRGTVTVSLASDEALLTDYAALAVNGGARAFQTSLRAVCDYVIGTATGNRIGNTSGWVDTTGWALSTNGAATGTLQRRTGVTGISTSTSIRATLTALGTATFFGITASADGARVAVTPGQQVRGRAELRTNANVPIGLGIQWRTADGTYISQTPWTYIQPGTSVWGTAVMPVATAPDTAAYASLTVRRSDALAVNTYVDITGAKLAIGTDAPAALNGTPATDADVTAAWELTNLFVNPMSNTTYGWAAGTNSTLTVVVGGSPWALGAGYIRLAATAAGIVNGNLFSGFSVKPGDSLYMAAWTRGSTPTARWLVIWTDSTGATIKQALTPAIAVGSSTSTLIDGILVAPAGAERANVYFQANATAAGQAIAVDGTTIARSVEAVAPFAGSLAADAYYTYSWAGTAHQSATTRRPIVARQPAQFVWKPGVTAWDFLNPMLTAAGFRLFCDEQRVWRMILPADYEVPGTVTLTPTTIVEATDTISRNDGERFATGIVVRYAWDDETGQGQIAYDTAGTPEKVVVIDQLRPYPGPGAAAAILARRNGSGRAQAITALGDWTLSPGMTGVISVPDAPQQLGKLASARWSLGDDALMDVGTLTLIDIPPGAIDLLVGTIDALVGTIDSL